MEKQPSGAKKRRIQTAADETTDGPATLLTTTATTMTTTVTTTSLITQAVKEEEEDEEEGAEQQQYAATGLRKKRSGKGSGGGVSLATTNSAEVVSASFTTEEPSFITSSPRFSPRRARTSSLTNGKGSLLSPLKASAPPPAEKNQARGPSPPVSGEIELARDAQISHRRSSKSKKDKALFSPLFVRLKHKRGGESDSSEPVTPESQVDIEPERHLKAKKSLKEVLERESGPQSPEKQQTEKRFYIDPFLELEPITYSDDEKESGSGSVPQDVSDKKDSDDDSDAEDEFDPYHFIRSLPPLTPGMLVRTCDIPEKSEKHPKPTLVLDLDETLVHCSITPIPDPDLVFPVEFFMETFQVYVLKRPHLETFLAAVSKMYEVIIFTASLKRYADTLLDLIDKEKTWIHHRLFRDSCLCIEGNYLKELSILKRDLATTVIVDNSPQAFGYQVDNGIPILSWYEDKQDQELLETLQFLETLAAVDDVRPLIREKYRLHKKIESIPTPS